MDIVRRRADRRGDFWQSASLHADATFRRQPELATLVEIQAISDITFEERKALIKAIRGAVNESVGSGKVKVAEPETMEGYGVS